MAPNPQSIETAASILATWHRASFGGKKFGRFFIRRRDLLVVLGRQRLRDVVVETLRDELAAHGLALVESADGFGVIADEKVGAWRVVPRQLVAEAAPVSPDPEVAGDPDDDE